MRERIDSLFELVDCGFYKQAIREINSTAKPTLAHEILRQLILVETDKSETAYAAARSLLARHITGTERLFCLFVLARGANIAGRMEEACSTLREAVALAQKNKDLRLLARAQSRLAKTLLRYVDIEAAIPETQRLRRHAQQAGDRRAVADFHCVAAEIAMRRGYYSKAAQHLQVAGELCGDSDPLMEAQVDRLSANLHLLSSEPEEALKAARRAVALFEEVGSRYTLLASLSTLSEHYLLVGAIADAEHVLHRILELSDSRVSKLATFDSLMNAAMARRGFSDAEALAVAIDKLGAFPPDDYRWLWHVVTRSKLHLALNRPSEALELLTKSINTAFKTSDARLEIAFRFAEVEALIALGAHCEAAERLSAAAAAVPTMTLEVLAEFSRLLSLLAPDTDKTYAERERRIRTLAFARTATDLVTEYTHSTPWKCGEILHSVAALFTVPTNGSVIAHEIATLLLALNAVQSVEVSKVQAATKNNARVRDVGVNIEVPTLSGSNVVVRTLPRRDVQSQIAVMAIRVLARAAVAFSRSTSPVSEAPMEADSAVDEESGMIVADSNMAQLLNITRRVATSTVTVLFTGETGTGKELLARALHDASPRRDKPFTPFNCTAVPRDMLDSQLFGYRRGAFTGAHDAFPGVIRATAGGTLFLDEIGEMPLDLQPKLLRFLESGEIHPLGEPRPIAVDVRIVAATNANLEQLVADGRFRSDLYYRLNVVRLHVPPLRERREEIPLLAQHYIDRFSRESHKTGLRLAEETMEYLVLFKWPGNVRQLTNEIRRMVALAESGAVLMPEHLSHEVASSRRTIPASQRELAPTEFVVRLDQPLPAAIEHVERSMIQHAMRVTDGRLEDAAHMLGLSRKGLYLKRTRLKMDDPELGHHAPASAGS